MEVVDQRCFDPALWVEVGAEAQGLMYLDSGGGGGTGPRLGGGGGADDFLSPWNAGGTLKAAPAISSSIGVFEGRGGGGGPGFAGVDAEVALALPSPLPDGCIAIPGFTADLPASANGVERGTSAVDCLLEMVFSGAGSPRVAETALFLPPVFGMAGGLVGVLFCSR